MAMAKNFELSQKKMSDQPSQFEGVPAAKFKKTEVQVLNTDLKKKRSEID
jgi:hypothetical protein